MKKKQTKCNLFRAFIELANQIETWLRDISKKNTQIVFWHGCRFDFILEKIINIVLHILWDFFSESITRPGNSDIFNLVGEFCWVFCSCRKNQYSAHWEVKTLSLSACNQNNLDQISLIKCTNRPSGEKKIRFLF